ncbi:hypothetical protein [Sphingosinicella terrae]|uniref:hypothetical protein n=1 Tax=Sphingosinicella terrae TaxID=2172047 RepID=UPI000E0DD4B8|nr:hypothetical protein [Sphingosinicella terrae]
MLRPETRPCCPVPAHPPLPYIRAGLERLPRQLVGFPEYRRAMLADIADRPALAGWKADGAHDLGVMLIEAWAYVLDITGFYDAIVADRAYVGTLDDDRAMRELVSLLGYVPRPAMVSRVQLALEAKGEDLVVAAAGTGFRSQGFDGESPQVFELLAAAGVWPQRNHWTLAPVRLDAYDGNVRFASGTAPNVGALLALTDGGGEVLGAGRVASVDTATEADGLKYQTVRFEEGPLVVPGGTPLSDLHAVLFTLRAGPTPLLDQGTAVNNTVEGKYAILDALYPQIGRRGFVLVEVDGAVHPCRLISVGRYLHSQSTGASTPDVTIPLTIIEFEYGGGSLSDASIAFHFLPRRIGQPTRPAETAITVDHVQSSGRLEKPVPPLGSAPWSGDAVAIGGMARGALLPGSLTYAADGTPLYEVDAAASGFAEPLTIPVRIHGNVVEAVRGETVVQEVLGSSDAAIASQRFVLRKKPLSWIEDASQGLGRSPQITLRIDGLAWTYVESFYGRGPDETVFRVEMATDGKATIVLGDGVRGARPPSGTANVTASYRFGAGAAKPPPGSIKQFARPARGLSRVLGPLAATGGADAESAADMGKAAPGSMLSLGRAVSVADFEAIARTYSGISNAAVAYSWDAGRHQATVMVWIISESGDPSAALAAYLAARALPGLPIKVAPATAVVVPVFDIGVDAAPGHAPETVREAVRTALFDPEAGLLGPRRIAIAAPLFRSHLLAAIHAVPGVGSVRSIATATGPMAKAISVGEGQWLDCLAHGQVL